MVWSKDLSVFKSLDVQNNCAAKIRSQGQPQSKTTVISIRTKKLSYFFLQKYLYELSNNLAFVTKLVTIL
jgi:hypothetical protein